MTKSASSAFARSSTKWATNPARHSITSKPEPPLFPEEEIYGIFSSASGKPYDMHEMIARIVDGSQFEEYRAEYGQTLLCGYARIGGWAVGIVANQKKHVHTAAPRTGERRMEFGGVIYTGVRGKSRAIYHGLQSESGAADFPA